MTVSRQYLLTYFKDFVQEMKLFKFSEKQNVYVACSGGADSMLLIWLLQEIQVPNLKALHVNYQSSEFSNRAQALVKSFCEKNSIPFLSHQAKASIKEANFEKLARADRYRWFHQVLDKDDLLLTGHNITDSMEWSWMQMFKSSHPKNWLGIPIRNGRIRRPLMGFSRDQIRSLVKIFEIPFLEDPSNLNQRFERNRIREKYLAMVKEDYPALEKNYAARHNQLAMSWHKHTTQKSIGRRFPRFQRYVLKMGGILIRFEGDRLEKIQTDLLQLIISKSNKDRGSLRDQFQKLNQAWKNKKEGPLLFSGGVNVFLFDNALLILSAKELEQYSLWDEEFASLLRISGAKSLVHHFSGLPRKFQYPTEFLCSFEDRLQNKDFAPRKKVHPLMPKTCQELNFHAIPWQTIFRTHLIKQKRRKARK